MLENFLSNDLLVFLIDSTNHYQLHHIKLNEKFSFDNTNQEIHVEHCCCLNNENQSIKTKFISCSHFLSFINMSCEFEEENNNNNKTNIHFVTLDTHLINTKKKLN